MFRKFKNPPSEYRILPLWIWSKNSSKQEIEYQIRELQAKGAGGFFLLPCSPEDTCNPNSNLDDNIQFAQKLANELGLRSYIYDSSSTNSATTNDQTRPSVDFSRQIIPEDKHVWKRASSIAHLENEQTTLAQLLPDSGQSISLEYLKQIYDLRAVHGINAICPNAFWQSLAGTDSNDIPSQFIQSPFWRHYKSFADYVARLNYILSQGRHVAQVAIIEPNLRTIPEKLKPLSQLAQTCVRSFAEALRAEHIDYDIVPEEYLPKASVFDQQIFLRQESYELLILPPTTAISFDAADTIADFVEDGGKLIGTVLLPLQDCSGKRHREINKIFSTLFEQDPVELFKRFNGMSTPQDPSLMRKRDNVIFLTTSGLGSMTPLIQSAIRQVIRPHVSVRCGEKKCEDISVLHRSIDDKELFFFTNSSSDQKDTQITIRCDRAPYRLDPETGEATALTNCTQKGSRTIINHRFERYGSLLICFKDQPALSIRQPMSRNGREIRLIDEWYFHPESPNCLILHEWSYSIVEHNNALQHEYLTEFNTQVLPTKLALLLDTKRGNAACSYHSPEVYLNGKQATTWKTWNNDTGYIVIDLEPLARKGTNTLRIVTNTPVGGELKNLARLLGSFHVGPGNRLTSPLIIIKTGSWTGQGYPYYSGTAVYSQTVEIPAFTRENRIMLRAEEPADTVEFVVNGATVGVRPWAPFEIEITRLVKPGPNSIDLKISNSLANFYGQQKPSGLLGGASIIIY